MSLVIGENISKFYQDKLIIEKSSFQINVKEKVGLIGANGVGKTTLLKLISEEVRPEEGEIKRRKNLKIGYLAQEINFGPEKTIYEEGLEAFGEILLIREKMHNLTKMMEEDKANLEKTINEYGKLEEEFEDKGGYTYEVRLKAALIGIGFKRSNFERLAEHLSGGEKSRLAYVKLLLREPDLLLLDEPTNHLDIEATEWLEDYLANYKGAMVLVSHDRYFLDRTVEKIWELEQGNLRHYQGNYTHCLEQKEGRTKEEEKRYKLQKREVSRQEEFIRRNIAGQKTKQAQSRRKMLQKMKRAPKPQKEEKITIRFSSEVRGGNEVLGVSHLTKSFAGKPLFEDLSFKLQRGDRWGIAGPNGTGKTTLLKIIIGEEKLDNGQIKIGKGVKFGYYDQYLAELNPQNSILEEVWLANPKMEKEKLRSFLGKLLFTKEDVFSFIEDLSGGEQARVLLAKLMLARVNFLILDEPTNHLDINSRRTLEEALLEYEGSILVVSHDRYFLDKIVKRILYFGRNGEVKMYLGNYSCFLEKRKREFLEKRKKEGIRIRNFDKRGKKP